MDYRGMLLEQIGNYYKDIVEPYKVTTTSAMTDARKLGLFKKRDFQGHIAGFRKHKEAAEAIAVSAIEVPQEDEACTELFAAFTRSLLSFEAMCEINMKFYDITEKKQYRGSGITIEKYKAACDEMQQALMQAVRDLDDLDKKYAKYRDGQFSSEEADGQASQPEE